MAAEIVAVAAVRGGTGKTSTAHCLAYAAAAAGEKVLLIDLDPQASLTQWQDLDPLEPGIFDVLTGKKQIKQVIQDVAGVDFISGSGYLVDIHTDTGTIKRLRDALEPARRKYSLIILDTGPALSELQNEAIFAASFLLLALESDTSSLQALYTLASVSGHIEKVGGHVRRRGVVVTRYDGRPKINRFYLDAITEQGAGLGFPVVGIIRRGVAVPEACAFHEPLNVYAPRSRPAADYNELYNTLFNDKAARKGRRK